MAMILGDLGSTATFDSVDYTGLKYMLNSDELFQDQGLRDAYKFSMVFSTADFTTEPESNEYLTVDGVQYLILRKQRKTLEKRFTLHLGELYSL